MDVPLALNNIEIRHGLQGYKRKSSTFFHQTSVIGFSVFMVSFQEEAALIMNKWQLK